MKATVLIIGYTFPEPDTTAAGVRMMQLISLFFEAGYQITFASTASTSERSVSLQNLGIATENIELNSHSFDVFIKQLKPTMVVFDRYITEEQFGWRVADQCPEAIRILDTEDLHFLRKARETAVKQGVPVEEAFIYTDFAKRELASILRCDLSLIISEIEVKLLIDVFKIPAEVLFYIPFLIENPSEEALLKRPVFEVRKDFMTIGNLHHAPNVDAVVYLKKEIWPLLRKELPTAKMHVYGSYAPQQITEMHHEKDGFLIHGWAESKEAAFQKAKVCVAPLRFGAGLKGKLLDAMWFGTPSVTTSIGAEGMCGTLPFSGDICDTIPQFVAASVNVYTQKDSWLKAQRNGDALLANRFQKTAFSEAFMKTLHRLETDLISHRNSHFIGQILQHQSLRSTKYMSKWIETKQLNEQKQGFSGVCFEGTSEVRPEYNPSSEE